MSYVSNLTIPSGTVASTLSGFTVRIDLSHLPAPWWADVTADGGNLRVKQSGTSLPFDVVWIDTSTSTGEVFFRAPTLNSGADNTFTVETVTAATMPAPSDAIGRYAVWADYDAVAIGALINRVDGVALGTLGTMSIAADHSLEHGSGAGMAYATGIPRRTVWTMGISTRGDTPGGSNTAALSYNSQGTTGSGNRETLADQSGGTRGLWNSTDGWRTFGTRTNGVWERRVVTHNGTTATLIYRDGGLVVTDNTVATRPGGTGVLELNIGSGHSTSLAEPWYGRTNRVYVRNGILSADWIAAEAESWETPSTFYVVGASPITGGLISETTTVLAGSVSVGTVVQGGLVTETTTMLAGFTTEGVIRYGGLITETTSVLPGVTSTGVLVEGGLISETTTVFAGASVAGDQYDGGLIVETTTILAGSTTAGYTAGAVDNDADGIHVGGTAEVTWRPNVTPIPANLAGGFVNDAAVAFTAPTVVGFTPYYSATATTARRLRQRVVFRGRDVSFFRGVPTVINDYQLLEPLSYGPASVTFPQINGAFELATSFNWLRKDAPVEIQSVDDATGEVVSTDYKGLIITWNPAGKALRVEIGGEVRGPAAMRDKPPPLFREQRDAGRVTWRMLTNLGVKSRPRLGVTTGIEVGSPGGSSYLAALEDVHAQAWTRAGAQWTTMPDENGIYRTARKDRTTVDFTVYLDDAQSVADIRSDLAEEPNEIFATGVTPAGKRINFGVYPGLQQGPAPTFPGTLSSGDSGEDVTVVIRRLQVTRYLNADDFPGGFDADVVEAVKQLQEDAGLSETGVVNAATWDALWDLSTTGFSSRWSRILPAASRSYTRRWRTSSTGSIIERNPNHNPTRPKVSRTVDMGANHKRSQMVEWAKAELADSTTDQWTGTIHLTTGAVIAGDHTPGDPVTMMRVQHIKAGMNVRLPTLGGLLLHVSGVNYGGPNNVSLAVDSRARDAMAVWEVIQRNRASRRDPARAWMREHRSSGVMNDSLGEFSEVGGILGQDAYLTGGQWNVVQVVAGPVEGIIRSLRLTTTPKAEFAVAVFGKRISEGRLQNMIGDPLSGVGAAKWRDEAKLNTLDRSHALLYQAGDDETPAGYSPDTKSDTAILTGKLEDDAGFNFRTFNQPVLYLAVWADRDTKINAGRIMWPQAQSVV